MNRIKQIFRDSRIWGPLVFLAAFEGFMQTGLYRYLLRPDSYAYNVRRVRRIIAQSPIEPNVLILGTSVPYQGIQLPLLNRLLKSQGLVFQSGATEGAMIETQYALYRDLIKKRRSIQTILYVGDTALAWKSRRDLEPVNRKMLGEFPRREVFSLLHEMHYELHPRDYTFFFFRSLTYQSDLRDFFLNPLYRFKKIRRAHEEESLLYPHVNQSSYSLSALGVTNLKDCVRQASRAGLRMDEKGLVYDEKGRHVSDEHHRRAAVQTCTQAGFELWDRHKHITEWRDLYFMRLRVFYNRIHADKKRVVTLYPPYSDMIRELNDDARLNFWKKEIRNICKGYVCPEVDTRHFLSGPNNLDYYYDVLHLNARGAEVWTTRLARALRAHADFMRGEAEATTSSNFQEENL